MLHETPNRIITIYIVSDFCGSNKGRNTAERMRGRMKQTLNFKLKVSEHKCLWPWRIHNIYCVSFRGAGRKQHSLKMTSDKKCRTCSQNLLLEKLYKAIWRYSFLFSVSVCPIYQWPTTSNSCLPVNLYIFYTITCTLNTDYEAWHTDWSGR